MADQEYEIDGKEGKYYHMVVLTNKKLLLDDANTDLILHVGKEVVHAHAAVVACRCEEIIGFPQDDKKSKAKKKNEVKINGVPSATIMTKVLEYLYTGQVDFPKLSDKEILHLTGASRQFKLGRLTYLCEKWLREHMTIESVFHLLKAATDLDESRVKGFCLQFALQHYNEFISNKDGIYILGIELFQEVVAAFQTNPQAPKEIRPEDYPDTLLEDFKKMYEHMPYSDIVLSIGGENIKAHRAILVAHSEGFNTVFKDESNVRLSAKAFKSMLKFLYYGDDDIETLPSCELVSFSRSMKLPSLNRICEEKIRHSIDFNTVLPILAVAYLPSEGKQELVAELKSKCFPFILQNLANVDLRTVKAFPMMTVDLLCELQQAWRKGDYGLGGPLPNLGGPERSSAPPPSVSQIAPVAVANVPSPAVVRSPSPSGPPASGGLLGAQRNRPPPPPRNGRGNPPPASLEKPPSVTKFPPPPLSVPPPVPLSTPPPPAVSGDPPSDVSEEISDDKKKAPASKKDKKEEEKRKKEEAKRVLKEKKERAKMEKKFKSGKSSKDIY